MYIQVLAQLKEVIESILEEEVEITGQTQLIDDLEFDSVSIVELITKIEESFSITFNDEDLLVDQFETVDSLVHYIMELLDKNK